jgi:hypothetical protein
VAGFRTFAAESIHSLSEVPCTLLRKYYGLRVFQRNGKGVNVKRNPPHLGIATLHSQSRVLGFWWIKGLQNPYRRKSVPRLENPFVYIYCLKHFVWGCPKMIFTSTQGWQSGEFIVCPRLVRIAAYTHCRSRPDRRPQSKVLSGVIQRKCIGNPTNHCW